MNITEKKLSAEANMRGKSLLSRILEYTDARLEEKTTLRELADHCGVSVSTVTQTVQRELGISYHRYLTTRRMENARALISSGVPLEEVGRRVGYQDHSSFYRAFRQDAGMSPREFKKSLTREIADIGNA